MIILKNIELVFVVLIGASIRFLWRLFVFFSFE